MEENFMKHMSKMTATSALLLTLVSTSYAQSSLSPNQNTTGNQNTTDSSTLTPGSSSQGATNTTTASTSTQSAQNKNMPTTITPDSIQWKDAPTDLPTGAQFATLEGNTKGKGNI